MMELTALTTPDASLLALATIELTWPLTPVTAIVPPTGTAVDVTLPLAPVIWRVVVPEGVVLEPTADPVGALLVPVAPVWPCVEPDGPMLPGFPRPLDEPAPVEVLEELVEPEEPEESEEPEELEEPEVTFELEPDVPELVEFLDVEVALVEVALVEVALVLELAVLTLAGTALLPYKLFTASMTFPD